MEEIVGDLVTIVGGGLIPAARPLRQKMAKKGWGKKNKIQFSMLVFKVRAKKNTNKNQNEGLSPSALGWLRGSEVWGHDSGGKAKK